MCGAVSAADSTLMLLSSSGRRCTATQDAEGEGLWVPGVLRGTAETLVVPHLDPTAVFSSDVTVSLA